jgi:hypothetical protein
MVHWGLCIALTCFTLSVDVQVNDLKRRGFASSDRAAIARSGSAATSMTQPSYPASPLRTGAATAGSTPRHGSADALDAARDEAALLSAADGGGGGGEGGDGEENLMSRIAANRERIQELRGTVRMLEVRPHIERTLP